MKSLFYLTIFLLIQIGCNENNKELEEQNTRKELLISEISKEYKIKTEGDIENYKYTLQFMNTFIDSSNLFVIEPIFGIDDFLKKDEKLYIRFSSTFPIIYFSIECNKSNFDKLLRGYYEDEFKEVLLVIKFEEIKKLFLSAECQEYEDFDLVELDYSSSFLAEGKLITYKFIN